MNAVPTIYTVHVMPQRAGARARLASAVLAAGCLAVLLVAAWLDPSPAGTGTHVGIGLNRCTFLAGTGMPCLTCGMTTSFAHFVRGQLLSSLWVQPAGTVLAAATCVTFWLAGYVAVVGRPVNELLRRAKLGTAALWFVAFLVAAWGWKIGLTILGQDGA